MTTDATKSGGRSIAGAIGAVRRHPVASAILGLLAAGLIWLFLPGGGESAPIRFETAKLTRGDIRRVVTATGKLSAVRTVEVGSQVSGQIDKIWVDFNSRVTAGQPIARIDPARFEAAVRQAEAELAVARANVQMAEAELARARAALRREEREMERRRRLREEGHLSQSDLDTQALALENARAQVKTAEAQIATAKAQVSQREAFLEQAKVDLARTIIRSPIDGIVIERAVDPGQTVAASFQTPTLFRIAEDLTRMQVEASVDEADIGEVKLGQKAEFTVDAYPDETFTGEVVQIRKSPKTEQNVVTYTVIISAANPGEKLLPGMTATVSIITAERHDVLRAPVAAMRFRPRPEFVAGNALSAQGPRRAAAAGPADGPARAGRDLLWLKAADGAHLEPVPVRFGIADNAWVEVVTDKTEGR
ncbi:MAG: RND transporter [Rhodothalassiaceae bacterium]|nr:MAG: RND transporter [Rhodothalassiaceae bacterium]